MKMNIDTLAILHDENVINDEEFVLLHERFDLDDLENDECIANFRFGKEDLWHLADVLALPRDGFTCPNERVPELLKRYVFFKKTFLSLQVSRVDTNVW